MRRAVVLGALAVLVVRGGATGQTYPQAAPPRAHADAGALARDREIHERFRRGVAAEEKRDWKAAAAEFERVIALDPPEPKGSTARYDLALADANLGRTDEAVALLQNALHRDPHFAAAASNLVTLQLRRGDVAGARGAADTYLALAPESARARYARGLAALRAGDLATARADFGLLAERDASFAVVHYDLALIAMREGHDDAALTELDRALALSPGYARARFALGAVLLRAGRRADARTAFEQCARDAEDPALRALAKDFGDRL